MSNQQNQPNLSAIISESPQVSFPIQPVIKKQQQINHFESVKLGAVPYPEGYQPKTTITNVSSKQKFITSNKQEQVSYLKTNKTYTTIYNKKSTDETILRSAG